MKQIISMEKTYQTRDGREVKLLMADGRGEYPVIGATKEEDGWQEETWMADGQYLVGSGYNDADLIEVKPHLTGWVNVYRSPEGVVDGYVHATREEADCAGGEDRIACVKISVHEGEGLVEGERE